MCDKSARAWIRAALGRHQNSCWSLLGYAGDLWLAQGVVAMVAPNRRCGMGPYRDRGQCPSEPIQPAGSCAGRLARDDHSGFGLPDAIRQRHRFHQRALGKPCTRYPMHSLPLACRAARLLIPQAPGRAGPPRPVRQRSSSLPCCPMAHSRQWSMLEPGKAILGHSSRLTPSRSARHGGVTRRISAPDCPGSGTSSAAIP